MCSRQVTRLLLRSASVTKDSAIAASCDEPLAAGRDARKPRGGSTQRPTPRGLDCGYRVPHLARGLASVHLCDISHAASPTSPRLKRDMTFGLGQRSRNSSALHRWEYCGFHAAGWCFAVDPRSMGKLRFAILLRRKALLCS